ncbi:MAG TPA: hypothetical protein VF642_04610 [Propionibacteriaceae bacterium]
MSSGAFVDGALEAAGTLAQGSASLAGTSSPRAACLLARQALESVVDGLLLDRGLGCPEATMRSRLIALGQAYADHPEVAYRASTAWWRLSNSCHHHAYELDPTPAEAAAVVADVRWLADQAAAAR